MVTPSRIDTAGEPVGDENRGELAERRQDGAVEPHEEEADSPPVDATARSGLPTDGNSDGVVHASGEDHLRDGDGDGEGEGDESSTPPGDDDPPALERTKTWLSTSWQSCSSAVSKPWKSFHPWVHAGFVLLEISVAIYTYASIRRTTMHTHSLLLKALTGRVPPDGHGPTNLKNEAELLRALEEATSLDREVVDLMRADVEQRKWDQMDRHISNCLVLLTKGLENEACQTHLLDIGISPPYAPDDYQVSALISKRDVPLFTTPIARLDATHLPVLTNVSIDYEIFGPAWSWLLLSLAPVLILAIYAYLKPALNHSRIVNVFQIFHLNRRSIKRSLPDEPEDPPPPFEALPSIENETRATGIARPPQTYQSHMAQRRPEKNIWTWAKAGNEAEVQKLLETAIDIDAVDPVLGTPLIAAAAAGKSRMVNFLLQHEASPHRSGGKFGTAIQAAAWSGRLEIVQALHARGVDLNATDGEKASALVIAIEQHHDSIFDYLVSQGADCCAQIRSYGSALQAAVYHGMEHPTSVLLGKGADIDNTTGEYGTALQIAVTANSLGMVNLLLAQVPRPDVNLRTATYGSPLLIACRQGRSEIAKQLIDADAILDVRDEHGRTPLHIAAQLPTDTIIRRLLQGNQMKPIDVNLQDDDMNTALHHAAMKGRSEVVIALLQHGAKHSLEDKFGAQPLFRAAPHSPEVIQLLLEHGAEVDHPDNYGRTALHGPPEGDDTRAPKLLIDNGADYNKFGVDGKTPLHEAANTAHVALVRLLLACKDVKINVQDKDQYTPLHRAIKHLASPEWEEDRGYKYAARFERIAELLIERPGIDLDARGGATFQEAIVSGRISIVQAMIEKGVVINAQGGPYGSAVGAAASAGNLDMLKLLSEHNASVNIQGGQYGTPLQAAVAEGHIELVAWLLQHGAKVNFAGGKYGSALGAARANVWLPERATAQDLDNAVTLRSKRQQAEPILLAYDAVEHPLGPANAHRLDEFAMTTTGWEFVRPGVCAIKKA